MRTWCPAMHTGRDKIVVQGSYSAEQLNQRGASRADDEFAIIREKLLEATLSMI